ncbi:MAG: redoxin domain-containing protein [Candidatus Aenigmarchaeota archaeon]|nr:redoxin domain-containing protein [Candidatus Aenigmarchaeota archaeon]
MFESDAPEFKGTTDWINSKPLTMKSLRGKVVFLDFWTYSCVNCIRTIPHLKELHDKYSSNNLVIIGVHTPEFEFEKETKNIKEAVKKHGLKYPVVNDPENITWREYGNQYWPRQTLIDSKGMIRLEHVGEGGFDELAGKVIELLEESGSKINVITKVMIKKENMTSRMMTAVSPTPETYLGEERSPGFGNGAVCVPEGCDRYVDIPTHEKDKVYLSGDWIQEKEFIKHVGKEGYVALKYSARSVNIVLKPLGTKPFKVWIQLDGKFLTKDNAGKDLKFEKDKSYILVDRPDMYNIVNTQNFETHEVKIVTDSKDFSMYTFTFG